MRPQNLFALIDLTTLSGCFAFEPTSYSTDEDTYKFSILNIDYTESMETVFDDCLYAVSFEHVDTSIDIDPCSYYYEGTSYNDEYLNWGINWYYTDPADVSVSAVDLSMDSALVEVSGAYYIDNKFFSCDLDITPHITLDRMRLYDLRADWMTRDGDPTLWMDFDFDYGLEAELSFSYTPTCTFWNFSDAADPYLSETYTIALEGADLDAYTSVTAASGALVLDTDIEFGFTGFDLSAIDHFPAPIRDALLASDVFDPTHQSTVISEALEALAEDLTESPQRNEQSWLRNLSSDQVCKTEHIYEVSRDGDVTNQLRIYTDDDCVSDSRYSWYNWF